jgi:hypothetical protein
MLTDWSVAMSAVEEDPVVVVPWDLDRDAAGGAAAFVDLKTAPAGMDAIPEAVEHAALAGVLRDWNAVGAAWRTLKCDVFELEPEVLEFLGYELELPAEECVAGFGSYVDVVMDSLEMFASFERHELLLRSLTLAAEEIEETKAAAEFVLRRCVFRDANADGFCVSVFVNGVGADSAAAYANWAAAISALRLPLLQTAGRVVSGAPPLVF